MSKLGDRIRRALRTEAPAIGFGRTPQGVTNPSLLVGVVFASLSAERAREAVSQGSDACLFAAPDAKEADLKEALKAMGETPAGLLPRRADRPSLDRLAELGLEYVALEPEAAPAAALLHSGLGYVLVLEGDLSDAHLRTLEAMPLEAVFLRSWKGPLTIREQMELQRITGLSRKPLMLPVPPDIEGSDLEALREAGVVFLAIDGERRQNLEALPALRQTIESLPRPRKSRRREERPEAVLPLPQAVAAAAEEEEEEEEEEDL